MNRKILNTTFKSQILTKIRVNYIKNALNPFTEDRDLIDRLTVKLTGI